MHDIHGNLVVDGTQFTIFILIFSFIYIVIPIGVLVANEIKWYFRFKKQEEK